MSTRWAAATAVTFSGDNLPPKQVSCIATISWNSLAMALLCYMWVGLLSLGFVNSENTTLVEETCHQEPWQPGPWGALLEDWATSEPVYSERHGRIMALPPTKGYYVTERIDGPLTPPPPPPGPPDNYPPPGRPGPPGPPGPPPPGPKPPGPGGPPGPMRTPLAPHNYNEWSPPSGGKIVNRPNSYDTFRPSYPMAGHRPPRPAADRVDEPPRKQVSETDLYLLGAIEKLVYRVDLMEKRLRRMEENVHYLVAGADAEPEPCPGNFSRTGAGCFHWSAEALDWKGANLACRRLKAVLLELPEPNGKRQLVSAILADKERKGNDFWTGGLNPGLLWIWAHSARPVEGNSSSEASGASAIPGEGRCLALVQDAALGAYRLRGRDCALRHRFVCQKEEDKEKLANEIERAARKLKSIEGTAGGRRLD
ncbi:unnamed protein product, partial [Iphiclides podalirius]